MKQRFVLPAVAASVISAMLMLCVCCSSPLIPDGGDDDKPSTDTTGTVTPVGPVDIIHTGEDGDPYTVPEARTLVGKDGVWVEGYIVGTVKGSMKKGCVFAPPFDVTTNILIADTITSDPSRCMPLQLVDASIYQYALNLTDNPDLLHLRCRFKADIATYFNVPGLRNVRMYGIVRDHSEKNDSTGGNTDYAPGDDYSAPLTVAQAIGEQGSDTYAEKKWVSGYIVGWSSGKKQVLFADSANVNKTLRTNVALADSINELDPEHVVIVKLPDGCIRDDVNLEEHPENMYRKLTVFGSLKPYNALPGVVDVLGVKGREDVKGNPLYLLE